MRDETPASPSTRNAAPPLAGRRLAVLALLAGSAAIGFSPLFVRLSEAGPVATAFWRVGLAVPLFWLLTLREPAPQPPSADGAASWAPSWWAPSWRDYGGLILAGLCFGGDLTAWHWSIKLTTVANATLLANMAPIFVTLLSWGLLGQRFSRSFLGGLATALAGVALLLLGKGGGIGGDSGGANVGEANADRFVGDALALLAAVFYAGYFLAVSRLRRRFSTARIMLWSGGVTAAATLTVAAATGEAILPLTAAGWFALFGLAWFSHAGGQGLIAYGMAFLPAAFTSVTVLLQPVVAALAAWALLGEPLGPLEVAAMAAVLAGIVAARRGV